jgi:hypothetical protein
MDSGSRLGDLPRGVCSPGAPRRCSADWDRTVPPRTPALCAGSGAHSARVVVDRRRLGERLRAGVISLLLQVHRELDLWETPIGPTCCS